MCDGRRVECSASQRRAPSARELELEVLRRRKPMPVRWRTPGQWLAERLVRLSELVSVPAAVPAAS